MEFELKNGYLCWEMAVVLFFCVTTSQNTSHCSIFVASVGLLISIHDFGHMAFFFFLPYKILVSGIYGN